MSFGIPDFRFDEIMNQTHIFITSSNNIPDNIAVITSTPEIKVPQNDVVESST